MLDHPLVALYSSLGFALIAAGAQSPAQSAKLYPGEEIDHVAGYPVLTRFYPGKSTEAEELAKPLLVFVPGSENLARIAYGFPDGRPQDFLAFWLQQHGYPFLAISYPVRTSNPVFEEVSANFTPQDWANQVALATQKVIQKNRLGPHVVLLCWSLAGRIIEQATTECRKLDLKVDLAVSLAATAPLPQNGPLPTRTANEGFVQREDLCATWLSMLHANDLENGGRTIIPPALFKREIAGQMSVNLTTAGTVFQDGASISEVVPQSYTRGYPLVAVLQNEEPSDPLHALGDETTWNFLNGRTVTRLGAPLSRTLPGTQWHALVNLVRSLPGRMVFPVHGNHFFFVGEVGAKQTAIAINRSIEAALLFKREWVTITGQSFE